METGPLQNPSQQEMILCPFCGTVQKLAERCAACGGFFDTLSKRVTQQHMGPWFIRDSNQPFRPGCTYEVLCKQIEKGKVKATSIVRGPTTKQFWSVAWHVPGISHLFGRCHACEAEVEKTDEKCSECGAELLAPNLRDELGLDEPDPGIWDEVKQAQEDLAAGKTPPPPDVEVLKAPPGTEPEPAPAAPADTAAKPATATPASTSAPPAPPATAPAAAAGGNILSHFSNNDLVVPGPSTGQGVPAEGAPAAKATVVETTSTDVPSFDDSSTTQTPANTPAAPSGAAASPIAAVPGAPQTVPGQPQSVPGQSQSSAAPAAPPAAPTPVQSPPASQQPQQQPVAQGAGAGTSALDWMNAGSEADTIETAGVSIGRFEEPESTTSPATIALVLMNVLLAIGVVIILMSRDSLFESGDPPAPQPNTANVEPDDRPAPRPPADVSNTNGNGTSNNNTPPSNPANPDTSTASTSEPTPPDTPAPTPPATTDSTPPDNTSNDSPPTTVQPPRNNNNNNNNNNSGGSSSFFGIRIDSPKLSRPEQVDLYRKQYAEAQKDFNAGNYEIALEKLQRIKNTLPDHIHAVGLDASIQKTREQIAQQREKQRESGQGDAPSDSEVDEVKKFFEGSS